MTVRKAKTVTTSVKLPPRTKAAVERLARKEGLTPHGYLLRVIEQGVASSMRREQFVADARAALDEVDRTGVVYAADDVHRYLKERARGKDPARPPPAQWRK